MAAGIVRIDQRGRPRLHLAATYDAPTHRVILESTEPIVRGFCESCFDEWPDDTARGGRKARSCEVMVRYLSGVNRDRRARAELTAEVDAALTHQD